MTHRNMPPQATRSLPSQGAPAAAAGMAAITTTGTGTTPTRVRTGVSS
ncbi:hypothetical protein [Lysobacter niastensis]|uniref:Uncharacterized protein n=1 Tax=Lysobacter niastensis TaxID=380629 RepID=A0ABS0B8Y1_9GAMM|nr:hypothetical protein [Lysobacter niastensis]MBF6024202.1 hypothetical protein [Lysobacter niastensis]